MLYGVAQSGPNITSPGLNIAVLYPGDPYVLFAGTETPVQGMASVAFSRGPSPGGADNGITFYVTGLPASATVDIQGSNTDVDGDYSQLVQLGPDANGNAFYTDVGRALFYRATLSTYVSGAMPVVKAQR